MFHYKLIYTFCALLNGNESIIYASCLIFLERRSIPITMYPNSDAVAVITPQTQQPTVSTPPQSKRQERLEKGIKYFSSKMFLVQLILVVVFSVTEISYGRQSIDQCPISSNIPLFLLVHGSIKIVWVACSVVAYIEAKFFSNSPHIRTLMLINLIIHLVFLFFFLVWFILGNVWVWSVKTTVQTTDSTVPATYCQNTLYAAVQGLIFSTYIVVGITTLITIKRRTIGKVLPFKRTNRGRGRIFQQNDGNIS
jgi:hypothetical protein